MDSYDIIVTPDAEADLFEIRDYIARTLLVPDVALNYIRTLQERDAKTYLYGLQHCSCRTRTVALQRCAENHC